MSNPPRFLLKNHHGCAYCSDAEMVIDDKGPLVGYAWYELLRKAGDEMEDAIIDGGLDALNKARDNWNRAKEGKPSV